jgi:hypothetical protein
MHHVAHQGQQYGPYAVEQINQYLAQGVLDASSHAWDQNANEWVEIGQLPGVILPTQQAQPGLVVPVVPAQTVVQNQTGAVPSSGEKKKTEGDKKKKTVEGKPKTLKIVLMFGIAGILAYAFFRFGAAALEENKKPDTDITRLIFRILFAVIAFCWVLVCVTYPFRKGKKGGK